MTQSVAALESINIINIEDFGLQTLYMNCMRFCKSDLNNQYLQH